MKYLGFLIIAFSIVLSSCSPEEVNSISEAEQLAIDVELIDTWLADNNIADVIIHPTGIRYTINKLGTGPKVALGNQVRVGYEGRYLDTGGVFDGGQIGPVVFNAGWPYIDGWYHMVLEMYEGDEYTAYFPSKYGYKEFGNPPNIGRNEVLVFDMTLVKIGI